MSIIFGLSVFVLGFVQNAVFTAVSRSRNSGDILHHAKWAIASNALWFAMQIFIVNALWDAVKSQEYTGLAITGLIYVAGTSLGSVAMMRRMLKTEIGKRRVGAR